MPDQPDNNVGTPSYGGEAGDLSAQFGGGPDAMLDTLMKQYGLTLKQAAAYAQKLEGGGKITGGREVQGEAMQGVASREQARIKRINYYADVSKRYYTGQPVSEEDLNYLNAVHSRQHDLAKQQAQQALQEQSVQPPQGQYQSSGVSNEPDANTMDPAVREPARMANMTQWGQESAANPALNQNWNYDGFLMTPKHGQAPTQAAPSPTHVDIATLDPATKDKLLLTLLAGGKAR